MSSFGDLLNPTPDPLKTLFQIKRKIFISYHHGGDQYYYDQLAKVSTEFEIFTDKSLRDSIDSSNVEYVIQRIRDRCITGSSCTIVLCGAKTPERKYVDWETKATLDKLHGLVGVQLPTLPVDHRGKVQVPDRLNQNINSGYAEWVHWNEITSSAVDFKRVLESAIERSNNTLKQSLIINPKEIKKHDG